MRNLAIVDDFVDLMYPFRDLRVGNVRIFLSRIVS